MSRLVNRDGYVPVTARLSHEDLAFLTHARDDVLAFARLSEYLLELHQPREAGSISSYGRSIQRCRTCMWRWPCPTFKAVAASLPEDPDRLELSGPWCPAP
ncbi:MAG: hypothetical protein ACRDN9_20100 [Streptosporangiaceae bacterium]